MMNAQARSLLAGVYESADFTLDDVPSKLPHTNYSAHLLEVEPTFQVLSQHELRYGMIPILSRTSHIPIGILQDWRKHLRVDSSWRQGQRYGLAARLLTDEEETERAVTIRRDYLARHKYCPPKFVTHMGRQMCWQRSSDESFDSSDSSESEPSDEDVPLRRRPHQFAHKWRERFMRRSGFSLRAPHVRRRPKPGDEMLATFLADVEIAFEQYPRDRILNADETSWKIMNNRMVTVANCGSDAVACE
jgi:hypothetical protein